MSSSCSGVDHVQNYHSSQPRGFSTPPPTWKTNWRSPVSPASEKKPRSSPHAKSDLFHVIHKVPSGNSPYVRAKHVQLVEKDPSKAVSLFWGAINSGDRVDSALKDMAVVMKQLNRSDEAIEAIKSFRHLCPRESQESLDNILVELYKQSVRIEEEIEILKLKLKQVEKGIAFGGKRTKMARSQGKKIQITVEKEYSRLLGNIAWSYMQLNDFKSAEEHYRKALSFESDRNKQCNLAICLMHMNKLTEAKFLLQSIRVMSSDNNGGHMDESYAKSFERASRMLLDLESQRVLKPIEQAEGEDRFAEGHLKELSPVPLSLNRMNNGAVTEYPYEKRTDFDWRRNSYQHPNSNARIPKAPFTQPQRKNHSLSENANGGGSCRKLFFEPPTVSDENVQSVGYPRDGTKELACEVQKKSALKQHDLSSESLFSVSEVDSGPQIFSTFSDTTGSSIGFSDAENVENLNNLQTGLTTKACELKKSWADIVEEEDEKEMQSWRSDFLPQKFFLGCSTGKHGGGFNDENVDANIIMSETPGPMNHQTEEELSQKIESVDIEEGGYFTQPEKKTSLRRSQSAVRRSLHFEHNGKPHMEKSCWSSPLPTKALNFGGQELVEGFNSMESMKRRRRNRLQVFHDIITHVVGSPRP